MVSASEDIFDAWFVSLILSANWLRGEKRAPQCTALLNKSIFQPGGGRSGMIRGNFTCRKADAVQTQSEPPS